MQIYMEVDKYGETLAKDPDQSLPSLLVTINALFSKLEASIGHPHEIYKVCYHKLLGLANLCLTLYSPTHLSNILFNLWIKTVFFFFLVKWMETVFAIIFFSNVILVFSNIMLLQSESSAFVDGSNTFYLHFDKFPEINEERSKSTYCEVRDSINTIYQNLDRLDSYLSHLVSMVPSLSFQYFVRKASSRYVHNKKRKGRKAYWYGDFFRNFVKRKGW